jgi:hypothetical protein
MTDDCYMEVDKKFFDENKGVNYYVREKMGDELFMYEESKAMFIVQHKEGIRSRHGLTQKAIPEGIQDALYRAFTQLIDLNKEVR